MPTPIVQKLIDYRNANPQFKEALDQSFAIAYSTGLQEFRLYNIHSVDDYIRYMDEYVNWVPTENRTGTNVYHHICMFYFIIDLPPVREHQSPIDPSAQSPWRWLSEWLIEYAQVMGKWMDSPESISEETVKSFSQAPTYRMQDYPVPEGGWKTFNEFFARHIYPELRPIAPGDNVVVSPADCTFDGQWPVTSPDTMVTTFDVKGVPWSIAQLLNDEAAGTDYGALFAGGTFTHSFLGPNDYHRQHAPVPGTVVEARVIPGVCYLEVVLDTKQKDGLPRLGMHRPMRRIGNRLRSSNDLDAPDSPGYQFLQARGLILIDNPVAGLVAVLPIGMAQVSSVVLSVKQGDVVEKGQEISCFQFGGSDIVLVFQKDAKVSIDQTVDTHYNYGNAIATVGAGAV